MVTSEVITLIRKKIGLTQAEFAHECDVSSKAVSAYERGVRTPSTETAKNIRWVARNAGIKKKGGKPYTLDDILG